MRGLVSFIIFSGLYLSEPLFAGWSSSGGEVLNSSHNPWWVRSTTEVTYCVAVDEETFSGDPEVADRLFHEAVQFWRNEFDQEVRDGIVAVATQNFRNVDCDAQPYLRLQFGEGSLSAEQRQYFGDRLNVFVGIAVRTEYDLINLRGKGFIYIASDRDQANIWSNERALKRVLIHETGHLFGLLHVKDTIMDSEAPAAWYNSGGNTPALPNVPVVSFSHLPSEVKSCTWDDPLYKFFTEENPSSTPVGSPKHYKFTTGQYPIGVFVAEGEGDEFSRVGEIRGSTSSRMIDFDPVKIHLNPQQTVFPFPDDRNWLRGNIGYGSFELSSASFVSTEGWEKPLHFKTSFERLQIIGQTDNRFRTLINTHRYNGEWLYDHSHEN